jgi:hypothetical protein
MKKILPVLLAMILAFSLASCSAKESSAQLADEQTAAQINAALLSGYPQDALPLYQPKALVSCGFSFRENGVYDIGKDIYSIIYESTADQQSLIKYYGGLLTEQSESPVLEGDVITDQLSGTIGGYKVDLMFLENSDSTTAVYLTLGLPADDYVDANPYFSGYPADLVDQYGVSEMQEITYQQQYYGSKTSHYITIYRTSLAEPDYAAHYKDAYSGKQGFAQSESDAYAFSWQDGAYNVSVRYTGGYAPYITIDVSKAG